MASQFPSLRQRCAQLRSFRPSLEGLEPRCLMAVDAAMAPLHNSFDPEDVNDDGQCTPSDALVVINAINAKTANSTAGFIDVTGDGQCTPADALMVINRINAGGGHKSPPPSGTPTPTPTTDVRSIDGTGNNVTNTTWGSAGVDLLRTAPAAYSDGVSSPAGADRPGARLISNTVSDQGGQDILNNQQLSAMAYAWGQFIDHDLDLTPTGGTEPLSIAVPTGDPSFDPLGTGTQVIPTSRSIFDATTGTSASNPRQQINTITAWLDGSMIYGSDAATAAALRTMSGGLMKTSAGDMLPLNNAATLGSSTLPMANDAHIVPDDQLFAAGDVRANENIELTSLQTLFVREHNYWATKIAAGNSSLSDEQVYQQARAIVIAEIQAITYNQWLPSILGQGAIAPYRGYSATVNPGIANEFSTAAFRFGHSLLGDDVEFLDNNGNAIQPAIPLAFAFFNPPAVEATGIDPLLKYLASDTAQELDTKVVDSVRNFLFGPPGSGGLDLASLNIERGRDNGLADYNTIRVAYHLPKVTSFAQITSDPMLQAKLQSLYGSVNNIDAWVGMLAEDHVRGANVGPTIRAIMADQFQRIRDADRLWYTREFSGSQLDQIQRTTLAGIIERNTGVTGLQDNVFFFKALASGQVYLDRNGDGVQNPRLEPGVAGVQIQLLDEDGTVVATTTTDRGGRFRFDRFGGAGDYHVLITTPTGMKLTTAGTLDFHIASGGQIAWGLSFGLTTSAKTMTATAAAGEGEWAAAVDQVLSGV
jgi:peroxidase